MTHRLTALIKLGSARAGTGVESPATWRRGSHPLPDE